MKYMPKSLVEKLINWAEDASLDVRQVENAFNDFHLRVLPRAAEKNIPQIDVIHPGIDSKYVMFAIGVVISEKTQKQLLNLDKSIRTDLLWQIRFRLLEMGVDFRIVNPEIELPTRWELSIKMMIDGATPQIFIDAYTKIKNAAFMVGWSYTRKVDSIVDYKQKSNSSNLS